MADTISRQEAVDNDTPDFHERLEKLTGNPMIIIVIAVDPEGISVVGNVTQEGMEHYLQDALTYVTSGAQPTRFEAPTKRVN